MSEAKHTPGPWRIEHGMIKGASDVHTNGRLRNALGISSASYSDIVCDIHGDIDLAAAPLANARLIAAAPELLEALKNIVSEIRAYSSPECDDEGAIGAEELKAADFAIAKAEGKQ